LERLRTAANELQCIEGLVDRFEISKDEFEILRSKFNEMRTALGDDKPDRSTARRSLNALRPILIDCELHLCQAYFSAVGKQ
jgi:hypothetical protein